MRRQSRARTPIALLTVAGLITPAPGFGSAQAPATAPTAATAPAKAGAPAQTAAPTKTAAGAKTATPGTAPAEPDGGWPRAYLTPSGGRVLVFQPQIASWEGQKRLVGIRCRVVSGEGRREGGARQRSDRDADHRGARRAAGELHTAQAGGSQVPDAGSRHHAGGRHADHRGDPRSRPRHRARPRAGLRGHEHDHPEEHRGREGRPADHLLQHGTRGARELRRRPDLEPDQGQRSRSTR